MRVDGAGAAVGLVAVLAALLTGCTSTAVTSPTRTATATATASAGSAAPASAQASDSTGATSAPSSAPSPTSRVDPNAPAGQCADDHLAVSVQADGQLSGAGQAGSFVVFRNTGTVRCVLRGAPGVSLVGGGNGTQIGAAAARSSGGSAVTIAPGSYAAAQLTYPNIDENGGAYGDADGKDPQCEAKPVDGYRVYPPHSFRAFFSRASSLYGCSTTLQALRVGAVEPASAYSYFTPKF